MSKIYKQFYKLELKSFQYLFVYNSGNNRSQYKGGINLFGWDDTPLGTKYTNSFRLELIYD